MKLVSIVASVLFFVAILYFVTRPGITFGGWYAPLLAAVGVGFYLFAKWLEKQKPPEK
jgi:uncharacterized membrane protein